MSLPYSVAVALLEGAALLPQYRNDKLSDPAIRRLSQLLTVVPDDTLPRGVSCRLTVETSTGRTYEAQVDHPRGSIANPMTPDEMERKVHMLGDPVAGAKAVEALIDRVGQLAELPDLDELTRPLAAPRAGPARRRRDA